MYLIHNVKSLTTDTVPLAIKKRTIWKRKMLEREDLKWTNLNIGKSENGNLKND